MIKFKEFVNGVYAAAKFTEDTLDRLVELQNKLQLINPTAKEDLHSTILYSRLYVPFKPELFEVKLCDSGHLEIFETGDKNRALVLVLDSDYMTYRHDIGIALGATHDYDSYNPHITLSYDIKSLQFNTNEKIDIDIVRSYEYVEPLNP